MLFNGPCLFLTSFRT